MTASLAPALTAVCDSAWVAGSVHLSKDDKGALAGCATQERAVPP